VKALERERVLQALLSAVDAVNPLLPRGRKLARSPEAVLVGDGSPLDSLGLVNLIVAAEEKVQEAFDVSLTLLDEEALAPGGRPSLTLAALADHLHAMLEGHLGG
jgi:hypothetical protein